MRRARMHDARTRLLRLVAGASEGRPFVTARAGQPLVEGRAASVSRRLRDVGLHRSRRRARSRSARCARSLSPRRSHFARRRQRRSCLALPRGYLTSRAMGMPSAAGRFRIAMRAWSSAAWRLRSRTASFRPGSVVQVALVSARRRRWWPLRRRQMDRPRRLMARRAPVLPAALRPSSPHVSAHGCGGMTGSASASGFAMASRPPRASEAATDASGPPRGPVGRVRRHGVETPGAGQSRPASLGRLATKPLVRRCGRPIGTSTVRQAWMAAARWTARPARSPEGLARRGIGGSNRTVGDSRSRGDASWVDQAGARWRLAAGVGIRQSYVAELAMRPQEACGNAAVGYTRRDVGVAGERHRVVPNTQR